jgi:hypothetical protein
MYVFINITGDDFNSLISLSMLLLPSLASFPLRWDLGILPQAGLELNLSSRFSLLSG